MSYSHCICYPAGSLMFAIISPFTWLYILGTNTQSFAALFTLPLLPFARRWALEERPCLLCAACPAAGAADSALWTPSLQRLWSPTACSKSTPLSSDLLTFRSAQAPIEWTATWLNVNSALQLHHLSWEREREHLMAGVSPPLYLTAWIHCTASIKVWFKACGYTVDCNIFQLLLHPCLPVSLRHVSPVRSGHIQAFLAWITDGQSQDRCIRVQAPAEDSQALKPMWHNGQTMWWQHKLTL